MDFNPGGVGIYLNLLFGSIRSPESYLYATPVEWLGLRWYHIQKFELEKCFQTLSENAKKRLSIYQQKGNIQIQQIKENVENDLEVMRKYGSVEIEAIQKVHGFANFVDYVMKILLTSSL